MKKQILATLLLLLTVAPCLNAQRKELSQARSYIKSGKDFDKAEKLMADIVAKDSVGRQNPKVYLMWHQAVLRQYEQGNEKLYLKQKYDTTLIFNLTKRMFAILESLDSIDAQPQKNGKSKPKYRHKHAELLNKLRPNLYFGGTFHTRKKDYATAYTFFDTYIDCTKQPLFTGYNYEQTDTTQKKAAYWATYCGAKLNKPALTLHYADLARRDTANLQFLLMYIAEAYNTEKNDTAWLATLKEGFSKFPKAEYFFTHLTDYHNAHGNADKALQVANEALATDSTSLLFLFAKSTALLNLGRYDECIATTDTLISLNDTIPDAYYNAGMAYMNKILAAEEAYAARKQKKSIMKLYSKALPYMEKCRALAPDDKQKWAPALYKIYLNLNRGKQFEEIDKLLNSTK